MQIAIWQFSHAKSYFPTHLTVDWYCMIDEAFMFIMLTVLLFTRNIQQESLSNLEMKRRAGPSIVHLSNGRRKTLFKVLLWKFCHSLL